MKKKSFGIKNLSLVAFLALNVNIFAKEENTTTLDSVEVIAQDVGVTEGTDSYTTDSMNTSTKLNLSIKETPQTVSVITTKEMEDKDIDSYRDVLRNISGVGINNVGLTNFQTFSRGFTIDYYKIDGIPYYSNSGVNNFDMSLYDRVEVVKGANGLMTGEGNPSLSMNFVRKHANSKEFTGSITLDAGSWDSYSQTTDVTTPITADKKIRARVVIKNGKSKSFQDYLKKRNNVYYGIIDGEINDTSSFSLGASYQELNRTGGLQWGLPAFYSDGTRTNLSRSTSFSNYNYYSNIKTKEVFGNFKHYFKDNISLNLSSSFKDIDLDQYTLKLWDGKLDKSDGSGIVAEQYKGLSKFRERNFDSYVNIPFEMLKQKQEFVAGLSYHKHNKKKWTYEWARENVSNIFSYDGSSTSLTTYSKEPWKKEQTGAYVVGRFSLSDNLKLITGLRSTTWKYHSDDTSTEDRKFSNILTPYAGVVLNLNKNHSLFVSYTDIFQTQNAKDVNGDYLDPIVGRNYETGIKSEYFDGKLNTSFSVFRILEDNVAQRLAGVTTPSGDRAYEAKSGVVSKGFEISIAGQITDKIDTTFGFAKFQAKDADGEEVSTMQPRTTANLFVNYKFDKNLSFGGGVKYYGRNYESSYIYDNIYQDAYTLASLMGKYKINKKTSIQLNINNLFDEKYYEGMGDTSMVYGDPRNFNLSLKYSF